MGEQLNDYQRYPNCVLVTTHFYDSSTDEEGYAVDCFAYDHAEEPCPAERELFRVQREAVSSDG